MATMTPRECFRFAAQLRLGISGDELENRVAKLINRLGLQRCADTYIGNNYIRGVSGGERKRTSIGYELITTPTLMLLDEPTSGLDSTTSLTIVKC